MLILATRGQGHKALNNINLPEQLQRRRRDNATGRDMQYIDLLSAKLALLYGDRDNVTILIHSDLKN